MSWRRSRLSILVFLGLLYTAPLSSGDKGLWLSVTSMPVQLFGVISGGIPPEREIQVPDRGAQGLTLAQLERGEPALGPGLRAVDATPALGRSEQVVDESFGSARPAAYQSQAAPRGPPG